MEKTFDYVSGSGFTYADCRFEVNRYRENNNLAVDIVDDNGCVARVTVNMGVKLGDDLICVKTWSENEGMEAFLKLKGLVERENESYASNGYVSAPIMRLTAKGKAYLGLNS